MKNPDRNITNILQEILQLGVINYHSQARDNL